MDFVICVCCIECVFLHLDVQVVPDGSRGQKNDVGKIQWCYGAHWWGKESVVQKARGPTKLWPQMPGFESQNHHFTNGELD